MACAAIWLNSITQFWEDPNLTVAGPAEYGDCPDGPGHPCRRGHRVSGSAMSATLVGWSGRAPAPTAIEAGKGRQLQGANATVDGWTQRPGRYGPPPEMRFPGLAPAVSKRHPFLTGLAKPRKSSRRRSPGAPWNLQPPPRLIERG